MATPTGYDAICFNVVVSVGTTGGVGGGGVTVPFLLQEINTVNVDAPKLLLQNLYDQLVYTLCKNLLVSILPGSMLQPHLPLAFCIPYLYTRILMSYFPATYFPAKEAPLYQFHP